ncbi:MAG: metallophosphoesterase [Clostridia bacterium]
MALYTIADLHLSLGVEKPMDIFGGKWQGYQEKLNKNLHKLLTDDDVLVIGGDISWGINLRESLEDFKFIENLPGKKIILKGNHDLWWCTMNKMRNFFAENEITTIDFLFNNFHSYENIAICGTRGWTYEKDFKESGDEKVYKRELLRLENSLKQAKDAGFEEIYCFLHYPPIYSNYTCVEIIDLMKKYDVSKCIYGHLHSESLKYALTGDIDNIEYKLVSADFLDFMPILLKN